MEYDCASGGISISSSRVISDEEEDNDELKGVIDELNRGREIADELLSMLRAANSDSNRRPEMVEKILNSFTHSLSILGQQQQQQQGDHEVISNSSSQSHHHHHQTTTPIPKDRRGTYKRRRTEDTWTKETPIAPYEDGLAWRKYGQKTILNTKHPRNYFRCTHKYDQQCQATKQVQKIQDDPAAIYRTTYHGNHTCKKLPHHLMPDHYNNSSAATTPDNIHTSSIIWSFAAIPQPDNINNTSNNTSNKKKKQKQKKKNHLIMKQEEEEDKQRTTTISSLDQDNYFAALNFDDHFPTFDTTFSSPAGSDDHIYSSAAAAAAVYSSTTSCCTTHDTSIDDMASMLDFPAADPFQYD